MQFLLSIIYNSSFYLLLLPPLQKCSAKINLFYQPIDHLPNISSVWNSNRIIIKWKFCWFYSIKSFNRNNDSPWYHSPVRILLFRNCVHISVIMYQTLMYTVPTSETSNFPHSQNKNEEEFSFSLLVPCVSFPLIPSKSLFNGTPLIKTKWQVQNPSASAGDSPFFFYFRWLRS